MVFIILLKWFYSKTIAICWILHAKLHFWGFFSILTLSHIEWLKLGLFALKKGTHPYLVYIILLKWLEPKSTAICLIWRPTLRFLGFVSFFALSHIKWFKLGLFATKHGTQHYLVYIIYLKWLETKTILIWLILRAKLCFWGFLSVFGTFSHQVFKTWFVCHEKWHTTLFGIYYCVEMYRIKNNSHMLYITC